MSTGSKIEQERAFAVFGGIKKAHFVYKLRAPVVQTHAMHLYQTLFT
jgi:hypothetical protein